MCEFSFVLNLIDLNAPTCRLSLDTMRKSDRHLKAGTHHLELMVKTGLPFLSTVVWAGEASFRKKVPLSVILAHIGRLELVLLEFF